MSFAFDFSNDDSDISDHESQQEQVTGPVLEDPLSTFKPLVQPFQLDFQTTLQSLVGNRFTFNALSISHEITIYRREFYDVKHQLMLESDKTNEEEEFKILIGETGEDLKNQIYEGGLKNWECCIDCVEYLSQHQEEEMCDRVIELGCGTAMPSLYIFIKKLLSGKRGNTQFVLSDFNASVLRLVTIPNLLINWCKYAISTEQLIILQQASNAEIPILEDELEITQELIDFFYDDLLSNRCIDLNFIAGSWCNEFMDLLPPPPPSHTNTLVLSSETIYSPTILPIITEIILKILSTSTTTTTKAKAIVTAKDIYFGVGGSIVEFLNYLEFKQKQNNFPNKWDVIKMDSNLKRSIVVIE